MPFTYKGAAVSNPQYDIYAINLRQAFLDNQRSLYEEVSAEQGITLELDGSGNTKLLFDAATVTVGPMPNNQGRAISIEAKGAQQEFGDNKTDRVEIEIKIRVGTDKTPDMQYRKHCTVINMFQRLIVAMEKDGRGIQALLDGWPANEATKPMPKPRINEVGLQAFPNSPVGEQQYGYSGGIRVFLRLGYTFADLNY